MGERIMPPRLGVDAEQDGECACSVQGPNFVRFKLFHSVGSALAHGAQASSSPQRSSRLSCQRDRCLVADSPLLCHSIPGRQVLQ